jgi:DNA recombination protein RmuC
MEIALILTGLIVGGISIWYLQKYRFASKCVPIEKAGELESQIKKLELETAQKNERIRNLEGDLFTTKNSLVNAQGKETELREKLAREETERISSEKRIKEQREEFDGVKEQLKIDFKNLANNILEVNSTKFTEQNKTNIDNLLKPLGEKIKDFKEKVENTHETQTRDGVALREQIRQLTELNVRMSKEATDLTNALKGQSKTLGNWGELVLETLLENSGLRKGEEYIVRGSFKKADGGRSQPDIIINLPDQKHLVIDSKVSLAAYERYCSASDNDETKAGHLKDHIEAVRKHVNELTAKSYQDLYQISTPDFVMMFVPVDPCLIVALQNDPKLFMEAFDKGIFLVCPATLLFALRTIAALWKREKQNRNAMEIARRGGLLYDKFVAFYEQLQMLGSCLRKTQECYDDSLNKLKTGRGNLIKQVEDIKKLGARTSKALPDGDIDESGRLAIESTENEGDIEDETEDMGNKAKGDIPF